MEHDEKASNLDNTSKKTASRTPSTVPKNEKIEPDIKSQVSGSSGCWVLRGARVHLTNSDTASRFKVKSSWQAEACFSLSPTISRNKSADCAWVMTVSTSPSNDPLCFHTETDRVSLSTDVGETTRLQANQKVCLLALSAHHQHQLEPLFRLKSPNLTVVAKPPQSHGPSD